MHEKDVGSRNCVTQSAMDSANVESGHVEVGHAFSFGMGPDFGVVAAGGWLAVLGGLEVGEVNIDELLAGEVRFASGELGEEVEVEKGKVVLKSPDGLLAGVSKRDFCDDVCDKSARGTIWE